MAMLQGALQNGHYSVPVYAGYLLYVGTYLPPQHARTTATFTVLSFVAGSKSTMLSK